MREYARFLFDETPPGLTLGRVNRREAPTLRTAVGIDNYGQGIEAFRQIEQPTVTDADAGWPQYIHLEEEVLEMGLTSMHRLAGAVAPFTLSAITVYSRTATSTPVTIPEGGRWDGFEVGGVSILTNGACVIYRNKNFSDKWYLETDVVIDSLCYNNGRVFMGNVTLPDRVRTQFELALDTTSLFDEDFSNYVFWSSIGVMDFPLWWLWTSDWDEEAGPTLANVQEAYRRNELGWMKLEKGSIVVRVLPFLNGVTVYGDEGYQQLRIDEVSEYGAGFSVSDLVKIDLIDRDCVAGDSNNHLLIDADNRAFIITQEGVQPIDLSAYFDDSDIFYVSYDEYYARWYVQNNDFHPLIVSSNGVYEASQEIYSVFHYLGQRYGSVADIDSNKIIIETEWIDMARFDMKNIAWVAFHGIFTSGIVTAIGYAKIGEPEYSKGPVPLNSEGFAYVNMSALRFRLRFEFAYSEQFLFDNIELRWKAEARRYHRGSSIDETAS